MRLPKSLLTHTHARHNPDTGHYGTVTPLSDYRDASGRYCREFRQTITVDGRVETETGTACRNSDGSWQIV